MNNRPSGTAGSSVRSARHLDHSFAAELLEETRWRLVEAQQAAKATVPMTLVEVENDRGSVCFLISQSWIEFAAEAEQVDSSLVAGMNVPTAALLAILDGCSADWLEPDWANVRTVLRSDGVLALRHEVEISASEPINQVADDARGRQ